MKLSPYEFHKCENKDLNQQAENGMSIFRDSGGVHLVILGEGCDYYTSLSVTITYCPFCGENVDE